MCGRNEHRKTAPRVPSEPRDACDAKMVALPRASAFTPAAAPRGAWLFVASAAVRLTLRQQGCKARLRRDRTSDIRPEVEACRPRSSRKPPHKLDSNALKVLAPCIAQRIHTFSLTLRATLYLKSALRATLCSSLLQASGRSCKYLQQGTRKLPRRRGNRTARGATARARRRQRRLAPRATARAPVAPRSPHG